MMTSCKKRLGWLAAFRDRCQEFEVEDILRYRKNEDGSEHLWHAWVQDMAVACSSCSNLVELPCCQAVLGQVAGLFRGCGDLRSPPEAFV